MKLFTCGREAVSRTGGGGMIWGGEWDGMGGKGTFRGVGGGIGDGKCGNLGREIGEWEEKFGDTHPPTSSIFEDIPPPSRPLPLVLPPPPLTASFLGSRSRSRRSSDWLTFSASASAISPPVLISFSLRSRRSSRGLSAMNSATATAPMGGGGDTGVTSWTAILWAAPKRRRQPGTWG